LCAALFALSGCSSPCEDVCSSFNACALTERDHQVDCGTFCDREQQFEESAAEAASKPIDETGKTKEEINAEKEARAAGTCKTQFDAHIACWEANEADICNAESTVCEASATAWTDCVAKFCKVEANAEDQACVPQEEGPALPAMTGF
jgi:hypothetical protein